ncbi:MAG: hypothetical protein HC904_14395 [Blastochloris sp.]|nr:hypothetical protein [Blastochloris sp.]
MSPAEATILISTITGKAPLMELAGQQQNYYAQLGQILGNWNGVGWTGVTHTADWTLRMACGPGQEQFSGLMRNDEFFGRVLDLFQVDFRNPEYHGPIPDAMPAVRGAADPTA